MQKFPNTYATNILARTAGKPFYRVPIQEEIDICLQIITKGKDLESVGIENVYKKN